MHVPCCDARVESTQHALHCTISFHVNMFIALITVSMPLLASSVSRFASARHKRQRATHDIKPKLKTNTQGSFFAHRT